MKFCLELESGHLVDLMVNLEYFEPEIAHPTSIQITRDPILKPSLVLK